MKVKYADDGAELVKVDFDAISKTGVKIIGDNFVSIKNGLVRHDSKKLAEAVIDLVAETVLARDKKRIIDYYYVKDRLKKTMK